MSTNDTDSEQVGTETEQEEPIFGRTMVNGTEYDAVLDYKTPDGRATYGISRAEALAVSQVLQAGLRNTEVPDDTEMRVRDIIRTLDRTNLLEEVAEEVAAEERARGGI